MLSPIAPHFCEELWEILGNKESILKASWPKFEEKFLVEDSIEIVVQINGKLRGKVIVSPEIGENEIKKIILEDEKISPWLEGKPAKKVIIVPKKLVNIVI